MLDGVFSQFEKAKNRTRSTKKVDALCRRSSDWSAYQVPAKETLEEQGRRKARRNSARNPPQGRDCAGLFVEACLLKIVRQSLFVEAWNNCRVPSVIIVGLTENI